MADDVMGLIDQFGQPIRRQQVAELSTEISPIGGMHGRPPFMPNSIFGMTPERLGSVMHAADNGSSLEWQIVASQIELTFPHYRSVLAKRRRRICAQPITIKPASDTGVYPKHAELVQDWLESGVLQQALYDLTDAIGRGFSVHEIIWDNKPGRVVPCKLLFREARHFEVDWQDGETILLRSETGNVPLVPHKFVVHRHKDISGLVIRSGLHRAVALLWMFAFFTLRDWALFVQGYGLPIRLGRYGPEASDKDKSVLRQAVFSIAGDVAAIVPKSMEIEFITETDRRAGSELYEKRLDWLNREVSKLVLGGTAGVEAIAGGHAVGQEHRAGEGDVQMFDCGLVDTTLTTQLVQTIVAFSFGPQDKYPTIQIGQPDQVDLKSVIAGVADLANLGLKVKASEIRDRLGLSKPEEGDEVIGGVPAVVAPKPTIPSPAVTPPEAQSARPWLSPLIVRHSEIPAEIVEQMTENLAADAAGALRGMTDRVRQCFEQATDLRDLAHRVHKLNLPASEFAEAMAQGMALAELVGEASLVAELRGRK